MTAPHSTDTLDRHTALELHVVYRTDEDRDALVVFEGPQDAARGAMRPLHDGKGGVRIAYLNPDGSEPPLMQTEYAFYDGPLTPVRRFRATR